MNRAFVNAVVYLGLLLAILLSIAVTRVGRDQAAVSSFSYLMLAALIWVRTKKST